jgi:hypothetical protein
MMTSEQERILRALSPVSMSAASLKAIWSALDEALADRVNLVEANTAQKRDIVELKQGLQTALLMLDSQAPQPSHKGSCNPEAGCDGACMDASYYIDATRPLRKLVGL